MIETEVISEDDVRSDDVFLHQNSDSFWLFSSDWRGSHVHNARRVAFSHTGRQWQVSCFSEYMYAPVSMTLNEAIQWVRDAHK